MRYSAAFLTLVITAVFALSLLLRKKRPSAWGFLELRDGTRLELKNRESLVGGSASSDVCLTTSRRRVAEGVMNTPDREEKRYIRKRNGDKKSRRNI